MTTPAGKPVTATGAVAVLEEVRSKLADCPVAPSVICILEGVSVRTGSPGMGLLPPLPLPPQEVSPRASKLVIMMGKAVQRKDCRKWISERNIMGPRRLHGMVPGISS